MLLNIGVDTDLITVSVRHNEASTTENKHSVQNSIFDVKSYLTVYYLKAIEDESYGKPSGINATKADYWFHNLCVGDKVYGTLVFETKMLKKIVNTSINENQVRSVSGGDHMASKMYLMNIQNLFSQNIIKKSVDNE